MKDDELFATLTERDNLRQKAMLEGDIDSVEQYIGKSLRYVHGSGTSEDRSLYLERLRNGHYQYQHLEPIQREFQRFGETVVCNGDMRIHVFVNGTEKDFKSRYLQVWVLQDGDWKMVAWQTTVLPKSN